MPSSHSTTAPCDPLEWDSTFFGFPIAAVRASRLTAGSAAAIAQWQAEQQVRCVYFFADPDDAPTHALAEAHGFAHVDTRLTFSCPTTGHDARETLHGGGPIRVATTADIPALKTIARDSHRHTRFHRDPRFPPRRADALYERWIERSCEGWADSVLVAGPEADPVGYATAHRAGHLGLVAVRADCRRRGWAHRLVVATLGWFAAAGTPTIRWRTQGDNLASQHLCRTLGGRLESTTMVYHRWDDAHR